MASRLEESWESNIWSDDQRLLGISDIAPLVRFRTPRQAQGGPEAAFADANATARSDAIARLGVRFPGLDLAALSQCTDDARLVVGQSNPSFLDELGGIGIVDDVLANHDLPGPRLTFSNPAEPGHQPAPAGTLIRPWTKFAINRVVAGPLAEALADGYTAVFNSIDEYYDNLAVLCEDLDRVFGTRTNVNGYLSTGTAKGFGPHWDDHDVIILPVFGPKRWTVYEPSHLAALRPWVPEEVTGKVVWTGVLEPGKLLYLPRGWGHEVEGFDNELSLHFTIGLGRPNGITIATYLANSLAPAWPRMRSDVPYDPSLPATSYAGTLFDEDGEFARALSSIVGADIAEETLGRYRATKLSRQRTRFSDTFRALRSSDWTGLRLAMSVPVGIMMAKSGQGELPHYSAVAFGSRMLLVADSVVPLLAQLGTGRPVTVDQLVNLCPDLDPPAVNAVTRHLVGQGVAHVLVEGSG